MAKFKKKNDDLGDTMKMLEEMQREKKKDANALRDFFLGLLMFAGGLFMVMQNIIVRTSWGSGYFYRIGGWNVPNGLVLLPLLIGIVMLFMLDKKFFGWLVTILGIIFILLTIIMSVSISWRTSSAYVFVLMFGLVAAGGGLMLRGMFRSK